MYDDYIPRYNLKLGDSSLIKIQDLVPITNNIIMETIVLPISAEIGDYLKDNAESLCNSFNKDLIMRVQIPTADSNIDMNGCYYDKEDDDEIFEMLEDDEEFDDEDDEFWDDEDDYMDDDLGDDPFFDNVEAFFDEGLAYNFTILFTELDQKTNRNIYKFIPMDPHQNELFKESNILDLNNYIDDSQGDDWMILIKFRHPLKTFYKLPFYNGLISERSVYIGDKVVLSTLSAINSGIANIVYSQSFTNILKNLTTMALKHNRQPFIGTVIFHLAIASMPDKIRYNYREWLTEFYNSLFEDYVEFESKITPPVTLKTNYEYYKQTDLLGQYYYPNGINIRKEEDNNGRKETTKKVNNKKSNNKEDGEGP